MSHWGQIGERFNEWTSPLRPSLADVEMFKTQLEPTAKTLLLGVTPELQPLSTLAIDHNPRMIELYQNSAILGDWSDLPFESLFDATIGDGCLTVFQGTPELFFKQVKKALKPNGRLVLRVFLSPESKEDLESIFTQKEKMGFHAFKWRVAHSLANPYVAVKDLYRVIQPIWDHPTLEVYKNSDLIYYFPKLSDLPRWDHIQFCTSYELSDRCPVVTWKFP